MTSMTPIAWMTEQLAIAQQLGSDQARRLLHGRGGCFAGYQACVVDWLPPVAVVRLYDELPEDLLVPLVEWLQQQTPVEGILLQRRYLKSAEAFEVLAGDVPEALQVAEGALQFALRPRQHQNSGVFLDMRTGRQWLAEQAAGAKVLNLFAYTCGFSLAAVAGGAEAVVNVDMSSRALSIGRQNHKLSDLSLQGVQFMAHDVFKSWGKIAKYGPYDLLVLDPPSFQPGSFIAQKDYTRLLTRLERLTKQGSKVLACHNDPLVDSQFLRSLMAEHCPEFQFVERLPVAEDFPDLELEAGVKALVYQRQA